MRGTITTLLCAGLVPVLTLSTACSDGSSPVSPGDDPARSPAPPSVSAPSLGEVRMTTSNSGAGTASLAFETGTETYLMMFESTAESDVSFDLSLDADLAATSSRTDLGPAAVEDDVEADVLAVGYDLLERHGAIGPPARSLAPASQRTFWVLDQGMSAWVERPARLAHEGAHSLIYVDVDVSTDDFPEAEARALGEAFDRSVYDRIRSVYGKESDLDGNGRAIVLLTPIVNAQASPKGRVYGFFMPGDLSDFQYSNHGEIFYLLVPDPAGRFGPATATANRMRESLVGVAAHEFVHMISANQRLVERRLPRQEYWLEEGLAHFGEMVVDRLAAGNILAYLSDGTTRTSLVGSEVLTRGASTLFVTRLAERFGTGVIGRLMIGGGTGSGTVKAATGRPYAEAFHDWSLSLHNELYPVSGIQETFETLDLARLYGDHVGPPGSTNALGRVEARVPDGTSAEILRMRGGSVAYVVVRSDGGPGEVDVDYLAPASAALQVATVRIR